MRKLLLSFLLICTGTFAKAQHYTFSQSTGTYTTLNTNTISQPGWDYMDSYNLAITFPFLFGGSPESMIGISGKGIAGFQFGSKGISALVTDLKERTVGGPSTIGYLVDNNQTLIIQWENAGFVDGTNNDFINFQLRLYAGSNKIEIHYGPSSITSPSSIFFPAQGPTAGLTLATNMANFTISGVYLQGNPASATAVTLNNTNTYPQLNAMPANGTIYTFTPATNTGLAPFLRKSALTVFPNPATETLKIKGLKHSGNATIKIYDLAGKTMLTQETAAETEILLPVETLPAGTYLVEVISQEGRHTSKILKL